MRTQWCPNGQWVFQYGSEETSSLCDPGWVDEVPITIVALGPAPKKKFDLNIPNSITIINHLLRHYLMLWLHQYMAVSPLPNSIPLPSSCWDHHYVIVRSWQFLASCSAKNSWSSLVEVEIQGTWYCGELTHVLSFDEDLGLGSKRVAFGFMKWFLPYSPQQETVWMPL